MNKGKNKGSSKSNAPKAKDGDADVATEKKGKAGTQGEAVKAVKKAVG